MSRRSMARKSIVARSSRALMAMGQQPGGSTANMSPVKVMMTDPTTKAVPLPALFVSLPYATICKIGGALKLSHYSKSVHVTDEIDQVKLSVANQSAIVEEHIHNTVQDALAAAGMCVAPRYIAIAGNDSSNPNQQQQPAATNSP